MSKATVLTTVTDLTCGAADATQAGVYYDHVVRDLARFPWLTTVSIVAVNPTTGQILLTSTQSKLLAVFWDSLQLGLLTLAQVESLNRFWRDEIGTPVAYVVEEVEIDKTFHLYPRPPMPNTPLTYPNAKPLGIDFPNYAVTIIHTEVRTDVPSWLELPVALEVAAREMERESSHRDVEWAAQARAMADALFVMLSKG